MYEHTLLLAHGSRDPAWGEAFEQLANRLQGRGLAVSLAYMELAEPSMETLIAEKFARTAPEGEASEKPARIAVLPLFLAAGRHLREDVPAQIRDLESRFPVRLELLPALSENPRFSQFLESWVADLLQGDS